MQSSSSRDKAVLKDITSLKEASESRLELSVILFIIRMTALIFFKCMHRIATVHDQFEKELEDFTHYLDVAAHK